MLAQVFVVADQDDVLCGLVCVCWCRDAVAVVVFVELRDVRCAQVLRCDDDDRGRFLALCGCDCMVDGVCDAARVRPWAGYDAVARPFVGERAMFGSE